MVFGVDCTRLGECASLQGRLFDHVIFNFPHCGRKSGVKKNRDLLKTFFLRYNNITLHRCGPLTYPLRFFCLWTIVLNIFNSFSVTLINSVHVPVMFLV